MATGLKIPLQVNQFGGAGTQGRNDQLSKVIGQAFSVGDSNNAFQLGEIGMQAPIFEINDRATAAKIKIHADKVMKKLEEQERAKTAPRGIKIYTRDLQNPNDPSPVPLKPGEIVLSIEYINLETQTPETFVRTFS